VVVSHGAIGSLPADLMRFDGGRTAESLVLLVSPSPVPVPPKPQHLHHLALSWGRRIGDSNALRSAPRSACVAGAVSRSRADFAQRGQRCGAP
jgi:hypothetical protein